jgi:hypothetical protein
MKHFVTRGICLALASSSSLLEAAPRTIPFEVQLRICPQNPAENPTWDELRERFGLGKLEGETFSTWFLDTPALDLHRKGVTLRLREAGGARPRTEFVVKSWVADARNVKESWWRLEGFKCETNFYPGPVINDQCNLKARTRLPNLVSQLPVSQVLKGFTHDQKALLDELQDLKSLPSSIRLYGPLPSIKIEAEIEIDQWILPDGSRDTEISSKTLEAPEATLSILLENLKGTGFVVCPEQRGRTQRALESLRAQASKSFNTMH